MLISIDRQSPRPAWQQVADELCRLVATGALGADEQIPSVRTLALELAINPNTIQKAYTSLEAAGITYAVAGVGRFVSPDARGIIATRGQERLAELQHSMSELVQTGITQEQLLDTVQAAVTKGGQA
ncbi:MAG: GntR family transcriptional regulator [Actinomycetes bacterium]|jgi:GntR family transcriptional regulator|nr:GntR family transcriptional regulator [Actinomycetes bacterium]